MKRRLLKINLPWPLPDPQEKQGARPDRQPLLVLPGMQKTQVNYEGANAQKL
jgi:hypothetical protein